MYNCWKEKKRGDPRGTEASVRPEKGAPSITVICGHYGAGKTNVAVNLAIKVREEGRRVYLADVDIVNPYFRAADAAEMLKKAGVEPLIPLFANSNVDIPALPPLLTSLLEGDGDERIFIDVGGDDGAVVLGRYAEAIRLRGFEMICVVNRYRPLTGSPEDAVRGAREIEAASGLRVTGIVNCSSLGEETTAEDILGSVAYAESVARLMGVPLAGHAYIPDITGDLSDDPRFEGLTLIPMMRATKSLF